MQDEECKAKEYTENDMENDKHCIASIISQSAVEALYSGAAIVTSKKPKGVTIEGVKGFGDKFMLGEEDKQTLPDEVVKSVLSVCDKFISYNDILGDVSFEWVYDGVFVWVVQLNQIPTAGEGTKIVKGNPETYVDFKVKDGLQNLALKIKEVQGKNIGIRLIGRVGVCSHFGDLLRQSGVPSFIDDEGEEN